MTVQGKAWPLLVGIGWLTVKVISLDGRPGPGQMDAQLMRPARKGLQEHGGVVQTAQAGEAVERSFLLGSGKGAVFA